MGLIDFKIIRYAHPVSNLPDNPTSAGMTAAELKAAFDANATGEIKASINGIIDYLEAFSGSENIKGIRIAADGQIEVTTDGNTWTKPSDTKVDKVSGKGLSTNDYSNAEKSKVASNTSARHTHSNKGVLDKVTQTHLDNIDKNTQAKHNHDNKSVIDKITQADLDNIGANTQSRHNHTNKTVLDKITQGTLDNIAADTAARHSHSNKGVLDKVTQTDLDNITADTAARHSHSNISILNGLAQSDINRWNNTITKDNTSAFTPTGNYNPATKKYVDDKVKVEAVPRNKAALVGNIAVFGSDGTMEDGKIKLSVFNGGLRVTYDDGQ